MITSLACVLTIATAAQAEPRPLQGQRQDLLQCAEADPLHMPTGIAVAADGTVYVADGVNDRVIEFSPSGDVRSIIKQVGGEALSRPVSVALDRENQLWIADTGHGRLLCRTADGRLARTLPAPRSDGDRRPELTDLAPTDDGRALWACDNHNHRLVRFEIESGQTQFFGGAGESLGQLNHPFMLTLNSEGNVLVTDVLNGRISQFTSRGLATTGISNYGVEPGQVYRPKGIERDEVGNIWVSDSVIGVVQAFTSSGLFIDVLRDSDGKPMHFSSPMGIGFDSKGLLHVVELGADRVSRVKITRGKSSPLAVNSAQPQMVGTQARACTICHLELVEPLVKGSRTELVAPPSNPAESPYVSQSTTCLSCHDSSVVDSRRLVWIEHGHRTGVKPPEGMTVPTALPLVDGKIACRTCHSAHANGQFQSDAATAVFLRAQNSAGELCIGCHQDKTRGPKLGTHPTGGMPWPIPKAIIEAGAKPGPNPRELTCTVCHRPHGSVNDHLLVMGISSNQLCMTCHDQMRPGMFRDGSHKEHPIQPIVNAEQKAAIERLGTRIGPDDRLICLSCHKLHHGKSERFMLADELTDSKFCINCHSGKTSILSTSHNLLAKFPEEKNRLGMTPGSGGPCSSCHMFHRYARAPEISETDPGGGKCVTCHQEGRCAGTKTLGAVNHSKTPCVACHDPHQNTNRHFLRAPGGDLCLKCHSDYAAIRGGPHDVHNGSKVWPDASAVMTNECMACHRPHGTEETGLFRVPPATAVAQQDGACLTCHPSAAWRGESSISALHPQHATHLELNRDMPLVNGADGKVDSIGCRTCHNPHLGNGYQSKFIRAKEGEGRSSLCINCHKDQAAMPLTSHAPAKLAAAGLNSETCLPCHSLHGKASSVQERLLWPKSLTAAGKPPAGMNTADVYCANCHNVAGPGVLPVLASHPDVSMFNAVEPEAKGFLPLYDPQGRIDPAGKMTCRTCHIPHGRIPDEKVGDRRKEYSNDQAHAMRLMLRPFSPPNLCTTCHGADALRRFLYFHDPQRRSGPLTDPTADIALRREPARDR